ncbi:hypothetical protein [Phenylobacterium sp.]|uniref:hypothetical protein n=1 Tax=Phenylobacterium sp. TaxID=1871053 RepID=UPI0035C7C8AE
MDPTLDRMLETLGRSSAEADLSQVETRTWRRIAAVRRGQAANAWLPPARIAAVVAAMTLGAAFGAARAHAPHVTPHGAPEVAAFRVESDLAPSTLLDRL